MFKREKERGREEISWSPLHHLQKRLDLHVSTLITRGCLDHQLQVAALQLTQRGINEAPPFKLELAWTHRINGWLSSSSQFPHEKLGGHLMFLFGRPTSSFCSSIFNFEATHVYFVSLVCDAFLFSSYSHLRRFFGEIGLFSYKENVSMPIMLAFLSAQKQDAGGRASTVHCAKVKKKKKGM